MSLLSAPCLCGGCYGPRRAVRGVADLIDGRMASKMSHEEALRLLPADDYVMDDRMPTEVLGLSSHNLLWLIALSQYFPEGESLIFCLQGPPLRKALCLYYSVCLAIACRRSGTLCCTSITRYVAHGMKVASPSCYDCKWYHGRAPMAVSGITVVLLPWL